ncbi:hypothetical protein GJ496_002824 [Pomphorhynchus laevis]|nr:hypothetical protein GJ496_002824 [Pomphorhynchus laevis]
MTTIKHNLLSWIGSEAYQLINRLNAGQSLDDTGYIQLVQLLNQHFLKPTHIIAARYYFHQCEMGPNDTYATWLVNLKDKARLCRFFNQTITNECRAIEERIRDHIVMKTPHDHVRNTMLQMENPTLDDLMRVCKTHELIQGTQQLVQCRSTEFGQSMTMKQIKSTSLDPLISPMLKHGEQQTSLNHRAQDVEDSTQDFKDAQQQEKPADAAEKLVTSKRVVAVRIHQPITTFGQWRWSVIMIVRF